MDIKQAIAKVIDGRHLALNAVVSAPADSAPRC